jgi:hypothetical protein
MVRRRSPLHSRPGGNKLALTDTVPHVSQERPPATLTGGTFDQRARSPIARAGNGTTRSACARTTRPHGASPRRRWHEQGPPQLNVDSPCRRSNDGVGPLTAVTILDELGDARRFSSSRHAVRHAGLNITVYRSASRPRGTCRGKARRRCAGRSTRPCRRRGGAAAPATTTTSRPANGLAATVPVSRSRASCSSAATTRCASSARRRCSPPDQRSDARAALAHSDAPRPAPRMLLAPPPNRRGRP